MNIVEKRTEFGHNFEVEKLDPPVLKGAGYRHFRVYDNGSPLLGWQWCYDLEGARYAMDYVLHCSYSDRISYLEQLVHELQSKNNKLEKEKEGR